jgi:hypothetical protein
MKPKISAQEKRQLLTEIEELLERVSIPVRQEKGDFKGGLCTFEDKTTFIINKRLTIDQKLRIAKSELKNLDLDGLYLRPQLRDFLEET